MKGKEIQIKTIKPNSSLVALPCTQFNVHAYFTAGVSDSVSGSFVEYVKFLRSKALQHMQVQHLNEKRHLQGEIRLKKGVICQS